MFRVNLPDNLIKKCISMPESGMGYQDVIIKLNGSTNGAQMECME